MARYLSAGQQLKVGEQLVSSNGKVNLTLQTDGNLVLWRVADSRPLWASNTAGKPVQTAVMQTDGNFVAWGPNGQAYWASGTSGHGVSVVLEDDANLVVYNPTAALWSSGTSGQQDPTHIDPDTIDTDDTHLATGEWMRTWAQVSGTGLISGRTRTWCTIALRGFHASVVPVLLGPDQRVIWPADPAVEKHQYGVDGTLTGTHDRTDSWTNQVPPSILAQARGLSCVQYVDPKTSFGSFLGKLVPELVTALLAGVG